MDPDFIGPARPPPELASLRRDHHDRHSHKDHERKHKEKDKHRKHKHDRHRRGEETSSHKKSKRSRSHSSDSSSSRRGGSDGEARWIEKIPAAISASASECVKKPSVSRSDWMLQEPENLFSGGGSSKKSQQELKKPAAGDPDYVHPRELNPDMQAKKRIYGAAMPPPGELAESRVKEEAEPVKEDPDAKRGYAYGDAGSQWRMLKLRRLHEQAEQEGRSVEEIAMERSGSLADLQEWLKERAELDRRRGRGGDRRNFDARRREEYRHDREYDRRRSPPPPSTSSRHSSSSDLRKPSTLPSRSGFLRPGESPRDSLASSTSRLSGKSSSNESLHVDKKKQEAFEKEREARLFAPISADHAEALAVAAVEEEERVVAAKEMGTEQTREAKLVVVPAPIRNVLSSSELNKLQAKALRAKMMKAPNATQLEQEYEREKQRAQEVPISSAATPSAVQHPTVIPMFNSRGEYHDIGTGADGDRPSPKSEMDLQTLVRQERMTSQSFDSDLARQIATDARFTNNLEYLDQNVSRLTRKHEKTEVQKRTFAIADFKKNQSILDKCWYCCGEDRTPQVSVAAVGLQVYLALPKTTPLVEGHCLIVPTQHRISSLECEDGEWDEIRNFMKCLIRMNHADGKGMIFMETCMHFRRQRHCVIECIPVPHGSFEEMPAYFKQSIMTEAEEWAQNKKLINTHERGFRKSMVKDLPYFHVWFGLNASYGHVMESDDSFPPAFGKEVIAGILDLPSERWRKPRMKTSREQERDLLEFQKMYAPHDWTKQLSTA